MYKKSVASFWTAEEIDLSSDIDDWNQLDPNEKHFIEHILAFFAASDGLVLENLLTNVSKTVQLPEARAFYAFQAAIETIHSETYSLLIDTYITDQKKKQTLLNGIENIETVRKKAKWAEKYMENMNDFGTVLVAFSCVEGIMFSSSFASIFWLKTKGVMKGLTFSNELISRDEGLHTDFAVLLHSKLNSENQCGLEKLIAIVIEATELEIEFARESLPVELLGINADHMEKYIKFVANRLLKEYGVKPIYPGLQTCPLKFMTSISLDGKTNFFERRVSEYAKSGVMTSKDDALFDLDTEF